MGGTPNQKRGPRIWRGVKASRGGTDKETETQSVCKQSDAGEKGWGKKKAKQF